MRVHSELLPDEIVKLSRLPRPRVTQTLRHLKAAGRISTGRPYAPPLTARDVTRILIALSATSPSRAVEHERRTGRLANAHGATVESALTALLTGPQQSGQIAIAQSGTFVEIRTGQDSETFGELTDRCATFFIIPTSVAVAIGHAVIDRN